MELKKFEINDIYFNKIANRNWLRITVGLFLRFFKNLKYSLARNLARIKGAKIGMNSVITLSLALKCNSNLVIGNDCVIEANELDLRNKIQIGNNCIINKGVKIIRLSHNVESLHFETTGNGKLFISDYCWLATGSCILPGVTNIAKGSIIGAFSIVTKNTEPMGVYGGNPAKKIKQHSLLYTELIPSSMVGGDFSYFLKAVINKILSHKFQKN